jgi:hypothetical protein
VIGRHFVQALLLALQAASAVVEPGSPGGEVL